MKRAIVLRFQVMRRWCGPMCMDKLPNNSREGSSSSQSDEYLSIHVVKSDARDLPEDLTFAQIRYAQDLREMSDGKMGRQEEE